ncbi:hypothetical protein HNR33_001206 [Brassicibacter mesophilus]
MLYLVDQLVKQSSNKKDHGYELFAKLELRLF